MLPLRVLFPWMLLALLGEHFSLCSASARAGAHELLRPPSGRVQRETRKNSSKSRGGKFSLPNGMRCTWRPRDSRGSVKARVKCENPEARVKGGVTDMACEYAAKPQSCTGFTSNTRGFWRQVEGALRRQEDQLCADEGVVIIAMCKRAPRDAHFKLVRGSAVFSAQSGGLETTTSTTTSTSTSTSSSLSSSPNSTDCPGHEERRRVAEEYCSSTWASVCAFFFSMVQNAC